ncbi:MAG: hypothetical protein ACFE7R_01765 [Candidatus Hodarchaeota archaeon]
MRYARGLVVGTAAIAVILLLAMSMFAAPVDAATVLETENARGAEVGDSFHIKALGQAGVRVNGELVRALTNMEIDFELAEKGSRRVRFEITNGFFEMNYTRFLLTEGVGAAGRPAEGEFNGTIVFGFRFNCTSEDDSSAEVILVGKVVRTEDNGPVLVMKGRITIGNVDYLFRQLGRIQRI